MADVKISALPASSTPLVGTEVLPIVQSGTTSQVSVANLTAGRSFTALGMTLTSTDAGATAAPLLDLYRDSASPAAADTLGEIEFNGEDSAGNKQTYGVIHGSILSPTSTAEQGQIHFKTATAGALTEKMIIGTTNLVINEPGGIFNVRIEGDTDANLFYTDATNSRVGVGTVSPSEKLDVVGKIKLSDNLVVGTAAKGIDFSANGGDVLSQYDEYTAPSAACTGAITTAVIWKATKVGNVVTLTLPTTTGTASASAFFEYGELLPTAFRPSATTAFVSCPIRDADTNLAVPGMIFILTTGAIRVYKDATAATNFTAALTAEIGQSVAVAVSWTI